MIEFKDVTKKYDNGTVALRDVSITIEKGEFVFVVGSSGAGKSTFLKLMMREEVPSRGTITVDGIELNSIKKRKIPYFRRKLGVVFQDFRLIPTMTVFDNVAFAMRVIGAKEKVIRKRVPYVLTLMGLPNKADKYPTELSGGEQQRVALARALANKAEIIIADEPTGNVDPQMSREIIQLLLKLNEQQGTTVIMVTHEHDLVREFGRRVVILDKGAVVSDGGPLVSEIATAHINAVAELAEELTPVESNPDTAGEQPVPVEEEQASSVEEEQAAPVEEEQAAPVEEEQAASVEEEQAASVEEEQAASVEEEQAAPVEEEQAAPVEKEQAASVEKEQAAPVEEEQAAPVEEEQAAPVEEEPAVPAEEAQYSPAEDEYFGEEADEEPSINDLFFTPAVTAEDEAEPEEEFIPAGTDEADTDEAPAPAAEYGDDEEDDEEDGIDGFLLSFFSAPESVPGDDENGDGGEQA